MRTLLLQFVVAVALVTSVRGDDRQKSYELRHSFPRRGIPGTWETDTNHVVSGSSYFGQLVEPNELTKPKSKRDEYWLNHGTKTPDESGGMTNEFINGAWTYLEPVAEVAPEPSSWLLILTAADRTLMAGGMACAMVCLVMFFVEWLTSRRTR